MAKKYFCLALPDKMLGQVREITGSRGTTTTSYIRGAVAARVESDITGQRRCANGEPCVLLYMSDPAKLAATAKADLDRRPVLRSGG